MLKRKYITMFDSTPCFGREVSEINVTNQDQGISVRDLLDGWVKGTPSLPMDDRPQFFGVPLDQCGEPTGFETGYDRDIFDAHDYMRNEGKKTEVTTPPVDPSNL